MIPQRFKIFLQFQSSLSSVSTGWIVQKSSESTGVYKIIFSQDYAFPIGAKKLVISREVPVEQNVDLGNPVIF